VSIAENKALERRTVEVIVNQRQLDRLGEFFAEHCVCHPPGAPDLVGLEELRQFVAMYLTAFPDGHWTIEDLIGEGDKLVVRWTARGTQSGKLGPIAPTGKAMTISGVWVVRFADGKTAELWHEYDQFGLLRQLGVV
jgi:steroid delta-isomerase-like uncharacterized protein